MKLAPNAKQCKQCPFRPTSLPGWLGDYDPSSAFRSIWHGQPFFCHTKIDYSDPDWLEKAMKPRGGHLCVGGLAFANKMLAPEATYLPIKIGRERVRLMEGIECMRPNEFAKHHEKSLAEQTDEIQERLKSRLAERRAVRHEEDV